MPTLPSGLKLGISTHFIIEDVENWFSCPEGYFWMWYPGEENGDPPYPLDCQLLMDPRHFAVPQSRDEAKHFVCVIEFKDDRKFGWRGEWLSDFPRHTYLDDADLKAWRDWLGTPDIEAFLDNTLKKCRRLSERATKSSGMVHFQTSP